MTIGKILSLLPVGECTGSYEVQLDKVGAMIIWCRDASGSEAVSSDSTSYHNLFARRAGRQLAVVQKRSLQEPDPPWMVGVQIAQAT